MRKISTSTKIFIRLVLLYAVLAAVSVYLPAYQGLVPEAELPAPKPVLALANAGIVLVLYGSLGFTGLNLAKKLGFPDIWEPEVSNRERFITPAAVGAALGFFLIVSDLIFSRFNGIGRFPHPPFPSSIIASLAAGIGEEVLFRLFFIPFWVWLISWLILRRRFQNQTFWIISVLSALTFGMGHIPALMLLSSFRTLSEIPPVLILEIVLLNGVVSMFAAYYFRKYGFLAPVGIHFWTDVVWHVLWGLF